MPANLVFVPYPYPLVMPDVHSSTSATDTTTTTTQTTPTTTTTTPTTTTETATTTTTETSITSIETREDPVIRLKAPCDQKATNRFGNNFYDELRSNMKYRQDYQKDFREQLGIRPVKPNTSIPKYGIVPIPDKIMQSLFSQARNNKRS